MTVSVYIILIILAVIGVLYLLAIMPRVMAKPDYTPFLHRYYAHRGLHDNTAEAPENSLFAFQKAVEAGYGIELDVQLTKDDVLVVFHDESLKRVCRQEGKVLDYTYEELLQFSLLQSKEIIPTFEEVLDLVDGRVPLIVEIKMHSVSTKVCEATNRMLQDYRGVYCIESFHPLAVLWYKRNCPNVVRGQLSSNLNKDMHKRSISYFVVKNLLTNFITRPDFIAYCHTYKSGISRTLCKALYKSLSVAWTIKSQEELDKSKESFDLFIFEGFIPK